MHGPLNVKCLWKVLQTVTVTESLPTEILYLKNALFQYQHCLYFLHYTSWYSVFNKNLSRYSTQKKKNTWAATRISKIIIVLFVC